MKQHHIIDAALSFLCLTAMAALMVIQIPWIPGRGTENSRKGTIAYGYHGETNHCAGGTANGVVDSLEGCDDNNSTNGDGCSSVCIVETGYTCSGAPSSCSPVCGDNLIKGSEACDDGNTTNSDGCSSACAVESGWSCSGTPSSCNRCGNGTVGGTEGCDDGDTDSGDGCSSACAVESGWSCSGTTSVCVAAACGDSLKKGSEGCDDGNTTNGDGCSSACAVESGYTCTGQGSGSCTAVCGDSVKKTSENCDDGNTTNGDGCSSACAVESGYTCTGSPSTCVNKGIGGGGGGGGGGLPPPPIKPPTPPPPCGNGILEQEKCEECDNGRANGTSACTEKCILLYCGDGAASTYLKEECEGRIEEERAEDPVTKATVSRFWFITADCGTSCTVPLWTQKKNGTWEYAAGTGCKRDLSLPPCRGTPTERRVQVRPPFSCSASSASAASIAPASSSAPPHCGDGILQVQEGEECDRVTYDKGAVQRIGAVRYGCSTTCKISYCGDGEITPFAPLNEECDPEHTTYRSRTCAPNNADLGCTRECRLSPLQLCPTSPASSESSQPFQELEELLQSMEEEEKREEEVEGEFEEMKEWEEENEEEEKVMEEEPLPIIEEEKEEEITTEEEGSIAIEEMGEAEAPASHAAAPENGRRIGLLELLVFLLAVGCATAHWRWRQSR